MRLTTIGLVISYENQIMSSNSGCGYERPRLAFAIYSKGKQKQKIRNEKSQIILVIEFLGNKINKYTKD